MLDDGAFVEGYLNFERLQLLLVELESLKRFPVGMVRPELSVELLQARFPLLEEFLLQAVLHLETLQLVAQVVIPATHQLFEPLVNGEVLLLEVGDEFSLAEHPGLVLLEDVCVGDVSRSIG